MLGSGVTAEVAGKTKAVTQEGGKTNVEAELAEEQRERAP